MRRTTSASMLRTRSGAPLIVDDRLRLLLVIPAVVAIALVLDWLAASPTLSNGSTDPTSYEADASASVLPPPLPFLERTVLRRPEEYSNGTILRTVPAIVIVDDMISKAESDHIIRAARPLMKDAVVSGDGAGYKSAGRSNAVAWVPHDTNQVVWRVVQRLCKLAGVQSTRAESLQVIRYAVGQKYNAHFDAYDKSTTRGQRTTADGGNRMLTMLVYLRIAQQGGGTEFPDSGIPQEGPLIVEPRCVAELQRHKSAELLDAGNHDFAVAMTASWLMFLLRAGRAVLFHNCEEDGAGGGKEDGVDEAAMDDVDDDEDEYTLSSKNNGMESCSRPHPTTRHAGLPVERGEKWAVNLWVREWETKRSGAVYRAQRQKYLSGAEL